MKNKRMTADQAQVTVDKLIKQNWLLDMNGYPHLAAQNRRIAKRLKNRITSGKYPKGEGNG